VARLAGRTRRGHRVRPTDRRRQPSPRHGHGRPPKDPLVRDADRPGRPTGRPRLRPPGARPSAPRAWPGTMAARPSTTGSRPRIPRAWPGTIGARPRIPHARSRPARLWRRPTRSWCRPTRSRPRTARLAGKYPLAGEYPHEKVRVRRVYPPAAVRGLPATADAAALDQSQAADLRLPRMPPSRQPMRPRPHHAIPAWRPDLRVQSRSVVPSASRGQAGPGLAADPGPARRHGLANPERPDLYDPSGAVPDLEAVP